MQTLLQIDSSPLGSGASFSRELTAKFVDLWRATYPDGKVLHRDLARTHVPEITAEWIGAAHTPETSLSDAQRKILKLSDDFIADLYQADEYVFGVPMHNFSIPSKLKLWIDQIARLGKTFSYGNGAPEGLLIAKKATFLVTSGGVYAPGSPLASLNFVEPYLRSVFGFIGVTDCTFVNAGGTAKQQHGVDRATILQPALDAVRTQFQAA
jgi:FMN-dependent NADH-azoreductase